MTPNPLSSSAKILVKRVFDRLAMETESSGREFPMRFSSFVELRDFCRRRYPEDIWSNVDVLYRFVWSRPRLNAVGTLWRKCFQSRYEFLKQLALKRTLERRLTSSETDILFPFGPCRKDLQALIHPVTDILTKQDLSVTILLPKAIMFRNEISPELFPGCRFLFTDDYESRCDRLWARACHRRLAPAINQLCADLGLDSWNRQETHDFFRSYFWDKVLFGRVLEDVRPSIIFGIHYMGNPGYLAAIDQARTQGYDLRNILIQHGVFSRYGFHDFRGADCVILWGKYFEEVLRSKDEVPLSIVIGNPKLELALRRMAYRSATPSSYRKNVHAFTVLFVSQPGDQSTKNYNLRALQLFVRAVSDHSDWRVIYKLHPGEHLRDYDPLLRHGLISASQIVKHADVYELVETADLVVGTESTVLPDAIALGKPVLQLLPFLSCMDWGQYGIATASTESELCRQMDLMSRDPEYRDLVLRTEQRLTREMFGTVEGTSARVAEYLRGLL